MGEYLRMWVLLILGFGSYSGFTTTLEFKNEKACLEAKNALSSDYKDEASALHQVKNFYVKCLKQE